MTDEEIIMAKKVADRLLGKPTTNGALLNEALRDAVNKNFFVSSLFNVVERNKPKPSVWLFPLMTRIPKNTRQRPVTR